jgi:hypothetical protein
MSRTAEEEEHTDMLSTIPDFSFFGGLIEGPESEDEDDVSQVCFRLRSKYLP